MLILKFISIPIIWLFTLLICSLRTYDGVEFNYWGINDYTLFTALLYVLSTFTIQVILSRQLIYDYLHIHARAISFCTGLFFIAIVELARQLFEFELHTYPNYLLFIASCYLGNLFFAHIYLRN